MTYPILEHDATRVALIEPADLFPPMDVPEHCVLCFFDGLTDEIANQRDARIVIDKSMGAANSLYETEHKGQRLAFLNPGIGAPLAAARFEEAVGFGCRKFVAFGTCGVLDDEVADGALVVVSSAIRDEGVSYHYLPPAREVQANEKGVEALVNALSERGAPHCVGMTWTTDAPFRETPNKIAARKEEGCLTVEMEAAALMAVAQFRDVIFAQVLVGADDLSGDKWDRRAGAISGDLRHDLFWTCAEACLAL